ncbi:MAG: FGGY family carbohydrate kinase [Bacillota bacterium]
MLYLYQEVLAGLTKAVARTQDLSSVGFSTWGVDYALLDATGKLLSPVHSYRDNRTEGLYDRIFRTVPREVLYEQTGIMFIRFNTLVQLYADLIQRPWLLENAHAMLLMPDLFAYFLTGRMTGEVTIASTTQMFSPRTFSWVPEIPARLGIPERILQPIVHPGERVGTLLPEIAEACGATPSLPVIAVGGHDTASAISAAPLEDPGSCAFISAGTWSLLGMELDHPITDEAALQGISPTR